MAVENVYTHFDPTSLFAGDYPKVTQRVALPQGLNASGSPLQPGTLLGAKTLLPSYTAASVAKVGNTGNGTCVLGSPQTLANVGPGVYRVVFNAATTFQVYDPKGDEIGTGVNGTAFGTQVKFTTTAGGTAFVSGDEFDITVTAGFPSLYSVADAATGGNVGNGTMALASPAYLTGAQAGVYTLQMTSATTFEVFDPLGNPVASGVTGTAFATQVGFTLSAGGTAFVGGDSFSITVSAQALYELCVATATDGSQVPAAILTEWVDTSAGPATADAWFTGEFVYETLTIDASWTSPAALSNALLSSGNRDLWIRRGGATG